jgi:hypothetical protein
VSDERQDENTASTWEARLLQQAWGVIANAGWDGSARTPGWQEAAVRWRDEYHSYLDGGETWEAIAMRLMRERDALSAENSALRRAVADGQRGTAKAVIT